MEVSVERDIEVGARAFAQVTSYVPELSENFEIPAHVGRHIAAWDKPVFVGASEESQMRPDDYVVGILHRGKSIAYPLWVTDHYHVVNHDLDGDPVVFATCERCQSGAAFRREFNDRSPRFRARGMFNATLMAVNRSQPGQAPSLWIHYEGVAIAGPATGTFLDWIPSFHMTWAEWKELHPQTQVMLPCEDRFHRDARHGHGREEFFARPGMERSMVQTISGSLDRRYPENEPVIGLNLEGGAKAYPLREVKLAGGLVQDSLGSHPILVVSGPRPTSAAMAVFSRILDGEILSFQMKRGSLLDVDTGSEWAVDGIARQGPLKGRQLRPVRWNYLRWHAWIYSHRTTELYRWVGPPATFPGSGPRAEASGFEAVLRHLACFRKVVFERPLTNLELPHQATKGICIRVDHDPIHLYRFDTHEAAEDYAFLEGAYSCMPIARRLGRKKSIRLGRWVVESNPEVQYADPAQIVRLPDDAIQWSDVVTDPEQFEGWPATDAEPETVSPSFSGLIGWLKKAGWDVVEVAFLPHSQLRPGTVNAVAATLNGDRFLIYLCADPASAPAVEAELDDAVGYGPFVVQSSPVLMYEDPVYEIRQLPDDEIRWPSAEDKLRLESALKHYLDSLIPHSSIR